MSEELVHLYGRIINHKLEFIRMACGMVEGELLNGMHYRSHLISETLELGRTNIIKFTDYWPLVTCEHCKRVMTELDRELIVKELSRDIKV